MNKATLTIDMPQSCSKCPCSLEAEHSMCRVMHKFIEAIDKYIHRPEWCPLKPMYEEEVYHCETVHTDSDGTPIIELGGERTPLYRGDPNCKHEIVGGDNCSGIKCRKCKGWYCA